MENTIIKPVTIIRDEFIINLRNLIGSSELPAFILEPILRDTYNQVKIAEQKQLDNDYRRYQELIAEVEENKEVEESEDSKDLENN